MEEEGGGAGGRAVTSWVCFMKTATRLEGKYCPRSGVSLALLARRRSCEVEATFGAAVLEGTEDAAEDEAYLQREAERKQLRLWKQLMKIKI